MTGRNRTLWCCPRCRSQTARPLCFIRPSKIHSPSSIAQKGSISKPCPLRLGPGPLSVGKVFVAFVQVHGTQTAARQGQAADLHSRLRPSMAAPAQTRQRFEQRPRVFSVKGFLLLVCSHYLGSDRADQAYHFHLRELTKEGTAGGGRGGAALSSCAFQFQVTHFKGPIFQPFLGVHFSSLTPAEQPRMMNCPNKKTL